ncbi:MAG: hypothetical protein CFE21_02165 [Bacteroidetes bacterium B1(2017)]|nr:MAG: hypothetical protein CFE21_02165 [Bacteroidetes bacterium B1(2017)]
MGIKRILLLSCVSFLLGCKKEQKENYYFKEGLYGIVMHPDEGLPPHTNPNVFYYYIQRNEFFPAHYWGKGQDTFCLIQTAGNLIPGVDSLYLPRLRVASTNNSACGFYDEEFGGDTFILFPSKLVPINGIIEGRYSIQWSKKGSGKIEYGTFGMYTMRLK